MPGKLVLIIGPSGVGKSAILRKLQAGNAKFHFPRSATTRAKREGEKSDLYHFVTESQMDTLIKEGKVLEWAEVHGGARYATLIDEIIPFIERGTTVIREVDVQGFESIRSHKLFSGTSPKYRLQSIFILPESKEQLLAHIAKRAPMAKDELDRRMKSIEKELAFASLCTAQVKNREGKLDETLKDVKRLITEEDGAPGRI